MLHPEKEIRLSGLGAPDETTLAPLNAVYANPAEQKNEQAQRGYCFHCRRYGHFEAQSPKLKKDRYLENKAENGDVNALLYTITQK